MDLGEGVMAGGAGEAYARGTRRQTEKRRSIFEIPERANSTTSEIVIGVCQNCNAKAKYVTETRLIFELETLRGNEYVPAKPIFSRGVGHWH